MRRLYNTELNAFALQSRQRKGYTDLQIFDFDIRISYGFLDFPVLQRLLVVRWLHYQESPGHRDARIRMYECQ